MKVVWIIVITLLLIGGIVGLIVYLMGKDGYKPIDNNSKKYITFTNHKSKQLIPNKNTTFRYFGGMNHVKNCLNRLIQAAIDKNFIAILPPPWRCLHKIHNNNKEISKDINWDYYFDVSELVNKQIIAPMNVRVHNKNGTVKWNNKKIQYISRDNKLDNLNPDIDIYVVSHYNSKNSKNYQCYLYWKWPEMDYLNTPSNKINKIANKIYKRIGKFNMINIRSVYPPWSIKLLVSNKKHRGITYKKLIDTSQVKYIHNKLIEYNVSNKIPIIFCCHFDKWDNSKLKKYLKQIKLLPYNIILESEIKELSSLLDNNEIIYQIIKNLSLLTNKRFCNIQTRGFSEKYILL